MKTPIALACLALAATSPSQIKATRIEPLTVAGPKSFGRTQIQRGESCGITVRVSREFKSAKARLLRHALAPSPNRITAVQKEVAHETALFLNRAPLESAYTGSLHVPISLKNGRYDLEVELAGVGKFGPVPVVVGDPPVKVVSFSGAERVGGKLSFTVNYAPATCKIIVTRTKNAPFPEEWWAPHKSVAQKTVVLSPKRTVNSDSTIKLEATLPEKVGAGNFQARVVGGAGNSASEYRKFAFSFPKSAPHEYRLRFDSMECLVETDEVGDDEIYSIHIAGIVLKKDDPGYPGVRTTLIEPRSMSEGRKRNINAVTLTSDKLDTHTLLWAVALLENDGGIPKGYENAVQQAAWSDILREWYNPARVGGTIVDAIRAEQEDQDRFVGNNDDYIGWSFVPFEQVDLTKARTVQGWHPRTIEISGDGGRYRLTFSVSAWPKQK